ncbi:SpoIID/LytB domain-containing protein [Nocardioides sp. TRM66260-LWL]|uniref:SpoIID/LytB domain-containing protein n=1 Tax=Nocardioides sp. TRM66260-LWL TaxID=2874478 RepID=UPI001CC38F1F|nr:SpoIID/LytB domain-containing protein [Nocardioides sp. TRM66260-LWL]MBZ5733277.1 SpoIID/LytB domain-containing protein [Nocardioides sp. TRM66260-LWL]
MSRIRRLPALLPLLLPLALAAPATAATAAAPPEPAARALAGITVRGSGAGHGHGLSQWGAQGAAIKGLDHRAILRFYYPGTTLGTASGVIRVRLTALRSDRLPVRAQRALTVGSVGKAARSLYRADPKATWWRAVPFGTTGQTRIQGSRDGRTWRGLTTLTGTVQFAAPNSVLTLREDDGDLTRYRGLLRLASDGEGHRDVVNVVALESYVRGVVPKEVPALWRRAAVQAQAVAARTYAVYERAHPQARQYDLCDTAACQVYGGASAEHPASDSAIASVPGRILTSDGAPIFAQFSASNGGWASAGDFAYLPAHLDPYDDATGNPYRGWTRTISAATIEAAYPLVGDLTGVTVLTRDGDGDADVPYRGRVVSLRLDGVQDGVPTQVTVSGSRFRSATGLPDSLFEITEQG